MHDRRTFLKTAAAVAAAAPVINACAREADPPRWTAAAFRKPARSAVGILSASAYDDRLVDLVRRGSELVGLDVRQKRVVLKPNFVEFDPAGAINTSPALVAATIEAFRSMGAASVVVAEGPGHRRDNEYILRASGLRDALRDTSAAYVDLNVDHVRRFAASSHYTSLGHLYLPETVASADLLVSMPKLKTHHWAGVTLSMKNMFGIMPGAVYGWPKNVLHHQGIQQSILDINATLDMPRFNIVDGIVGMEGDGPIKGQARQSGVVIFGHDPVAVDATGARLMRVDPSRIAYISEAGRFLGNVDEELIDQRGENLDDHAQEYRLIESFQHLRL